MKPRLLAMSAALALIVPLSVPAASAAPPEENTKYSYDDTFRDRFCGLRLLVHEVGGGHFMLFPIEESDGQAWLGHDNYWFRTVFTNRDNGESVVISGRGIFKELTGTQVDGDIWEFTAIEAGQPFVLRDSSGEVILRDRGLLRFRAIYDVLGDGQPGGELIEHEVTQSAGPHPGFDGSTCDLLTSLIG